MITQNSKTSFEHELEQSIDGGWDPIWESFRSEVVPVGGRESSGKMTFLMLLTHTDGTGSEEMPTGQERIIESGKSAGRKMGKKRGGSGLAS